MNKVNMSKKEKNEQVWGVGNCMRLAFAACIPVIAIINIWVNTPVYFEKLILFLF